MTLQRRRCNGIEYRQAIRGSIMGINDVIHNTGSALCITMPPEDNPATARRNLLKEFGED